MKNWQRNMMAFLESKAIEEDGNAIDAAARARYFEAGISRIFGVKLRGYATEIQQQWAADCDSRPTDTRADFDR